MLVRRFAVVQAIAGSMLHRRRLDRPMARARSMNSYTVPWIDDDAQRLATAADVIVA
jgi:hypothetical protein